MIRLRRGIPANSARDRTNQTCDVEMQSDRSDAINLNPSKTWPEYTSAVRFEQTVRSMVGRKAPVRSSSGLRFLPLARAPDAALRSGRIVEVRRTALSHLRGSMIAHHRRHAAMAG